MNGQQAACWCWGSGAVGYPCIVTSAANPVLRKVLGSLAMLRGGQLWEVLLRDSSAQDSGYRFSLFFFFPLEAEGSLVNMFVNP